VTKPDSWRRIKQVAEQRRDVSARGLAQLVIRAREAQQKLELLVQYRLDYRVRFESASRTGMRGEWLRNYQTFLANLEQAITLQKEAIAAIQHEVGAAKKQVDGEQRRAESYQIIDDRRSSANLDRERRRQQRLQDEMATLVVPKMVAVGEN
jgi:flagellar FliJ protein